MPIGLAILVILTELVHSAWLVRLPIFGQVIDPSLPLIIAVGFARPGWGPLAGLGAGLLQDLLFGGSLGLFALAKFLVGQGAGALGRTILVEQPALPWIVTAGGTVIHQVILSLVLLITGLLPVALGDFGRPLLVQILVNLFAVLPAFAAVRALFRTRRGGGREGLHGI